MINLITHQCYRVVVEDYDDGRHNVIVTVFSDEDGSRRAILDLGVATARDRGIDAASALTIEPIH